MTSPEVHDTVTIERPEHESRPPSAPPGPASRPAPRPVSGSSPAPMSARSHRGRRIAFAAIAGLVVLAAGYALFGRAALPREVVALSDRIEGDHSAVAAKTSGRLREIRVREGDHVEAGQVIAVLDDQQTRAREQQAEAQVAQAEPQVELARRQIAILREQLRQSELGVERPRPMPRGASGKRRPSRRPPRRSGLKRRRPTSRPGGIATPSCGSRKPARWRCKKPGGRTRPRRASGPW
jgi:biotin carboxyl carrier protein